MIPLAGQTLNAGHLMQPTANATGQSVMMSLPGKSAAGLHYADTRMVLPRPLDRAAFHERAGPLASQENTSRPPPKPREPLAWTNVM